MRNNLAFLLTLCLGIFNVTLYCTEELHSLCEKQDQESARRYIREHPACVTQAYKGQLPLHMASFYGLIDVVRDLLANDSVDHHATVVPSDEITTSGFNALHLAAGQGHLAVVECLLKQSTIKHDSVITGNGNGTDGCNALHIAAGQGHLAVVECLLKQSAIKHDSVVMGNSVGLDGLNALHIAAATGNHTIVDCLLRQSTIKHDSVIKGNGRGGDGFNALHIAAATGNHAVVDCLLRQSTIKHDSVITGNMGDYEGLNALHLAAAKGHHTIVDFLLRQSTISHNRIVTGNSKLFDGCNALHIAAGQGHPAVVKCLLEQSTIKHDSVVTGNSKGIDGYNALHLAAGQGFLAIVECLLRQSAIKHDGVVTGNDNGANGYNALHIAAAIGNHAVVDCLLRQSTIQHDSVVMGNSGDGDGFNALHIAARRGFADIVATIIDSGKIHCDLPVATTNTKGLAGLSPLSLAVRQDELAATKSLVYAGAPLDDYMLPAAAVPSQAEQYCRQTGATIQRLIPLAESLRADLAQRQELINQQQSTLTTDGRGHNTATLIQALITGGADIDYCDTARRTLLHAAMGPGNPDQAMPWDELAKWLISRKQNILAAASTRQDDIDRELSLWTSKPARCGSTPLSMAARYNNRRAVFLLLNKQPSTHALYSAVQECAACNHDMLRKIFLRAAYGPDTTPSAQTLAQTARDSAAATDKEGTLQLIAKK